VHEHVLHPREVANAAANLGGERGAGEDDVGGDDRHVVDHERLPEQLVVDSLGETRPRRPAAVREARRRRDRHLRDARPHRSSSAETSRPTTTTLSPCRVVGIARTTHAVPADWARIVAGSRSGRSRE
jgi:hypothetical protein